MKQFFLGFAHGIAAFFIQIWTFVKDHITDKSGFFDEKRTTALALLVLAVIYGIKPEWLNVASPNPTIFLAMLSAGVAQYFNSAYNDGRNPPAQIGAAVTAAVTQVESGLGK